MKHRFNFWGQVAFALLAVFLCALLFAAGHFMLALICLTAFSLLTARSNHLGYCRTVTLSVPEILMDVLDAFKFETPEVFGPEGFATDFSSKTAVLGDKITAKIAHVPTTAAYDSTKGVGFYSGAQDVTTLIEDVPVTLSSLVHVPIKIGWLTQLSSKIPLYKEAVRNYGYALGHAIVNSVLHQLATSFSNSILLPPPLVNLDSLDADVRGALNSQKVAGRGRFGIVSSDFAAAIQNDDRVKSSLFYGELNGATGFRRFKNLAGNAWVQEYPEFSAQTGYVGFFGDRRAITIACRRPDFSNAADELQVPRVMEFYPLEDSESGLYLTGVSWQEVGTGDVYVSAAILYGVSSGNQGGAPGAITDSAGLLIRGN
jgi:hypothetical protein